MKTTNKILTTLAMVAGLASANDAAVKFTYANANKDVNAAFVAGELKKEYGINVSPKDLEAAFNGLPNGLTVVSYNAETGKVEIKQPEVQTGTGAAERKYATKSTVNVAKTDAVKTSTGTTIDKVVQSTGPVKRLVKKDEVVQSTAAQNRTMYHFGLTLVPSERKVTYPNYTETMKGLGASASLDIISGNVALGGSLGILDGSTSAQADIREEYREVYAKISTQVMKGKKSSLVLEGLVNGMGYDEKHIKSNQNQTHTWFTGTGLGIGAKYNLGRLGLYLATSRMDISDHNGDMKNTGKTICGGNFAFGKKKDLKVGFDFTDMGADATTPGISTLYMTDQLGKEYALTLDYRNMSVRFASVGGRFGDRDNGGYKWSVRGKGKKGCWEVAGRNTNLGNDVRGYAVNQISVGGGIYLGK